MAPPPAAPGPPNAPGSAPPSSAAPSSTAPSSTAPVPTPPRTARPQRAGRAVVVGSGIAGLTAALELGECTVVTKTRLGEGASRWAQGGIAAALGPGDDPGQHAADTLTVAGGLADPEVVARLTAAAPDRIVWLQELGAGFDVDHSGRLVLGREAGHGRRRIVKARGDATGAAVMQALVAAVRARPDIAVLEDTEAIDLLRAGERVVGVLARPRSAGSGGGSPAGSGAGEVALLAPAVVLATGGIGRAWAHTTNPTEATGDGLAMAARAGAAIRDPEFVQFHPTVLVSDRDPRPLLTEALRGEGAVLVDASGRRYLRDVHPDAELAPRDVVARANWAALQAGPIHLDARSIGPGFPTRFPTVFAAAREAGLDPRLDPLPVTPSQHYHMGGVRCDLAGRTSLPGLYVCGEVASTGLHGANRLASNSLVEGLVGGAQVAWAVRAGGGQITTRGIEVAAGSVAVPVPGQEPTAAIAALRATLWASAGVVRDESGLRSGLATTRRRRAELASDLTGRNLATVAELVLTAALARRESRGGHHRSDHPEPQPGAPRHTEVVPVPEPRQPIELQAHIPAVLP